MENPLQDVSNHMVKNESPSINVQIKLPKKVTHFSDGIIEEFSEDEVDEATPIQTTIIDTQSMTWGPWLMHYASVGGGKALGYCDYLGEGLADILGITTPKYQLELSEHERQEAEKERIDKEAAGWITAAPNGQLPLITSQPPQSFGMSPDHPVPI